MSKNQPIQPPQKHPRKSEIEELEDSMETLLSEYENKADLTPHDVFSFVGRYVAKSEEFRRTVYDVQHQYNTLRERVEAIESNAKEDNKKQKEIGDNMEVLETDMRQATQQNEASIHKIEQKQIDNHVFIAGFPIHPDENEVFESVLRLYEIPPEVVDYKYSYEFTINRPSTSTPTMPRSKKIFQMVVAFKDQQSKINFMKKKKEKGPVKFEQLTKARLNKNEAETTIRIVNRLSKFNLQVQRDLMRLKNENKILKFQLHNGTFRVQEKENTAWKVIDTEEKLENIAPKRMLIN